MQLHPLHTLRIDDGFDRDRTDPTVGHGVARIRNQVDQCVFELTDVGAHTTTRRKHQSHTIAVASDTLQQSLEGAHQIAHVNHARLNHLAPRKGEELSGQRCTAIACIQDFVQ